MEVLSHDFFTDLEIRIQITIVASTVCIYKMLHYLHHQRHQQRRKNYPVTKIHVHVKMCINKPLRKAHVRIYSHMYTNETLHTQINPIYTLKYPCPHINPYVHIIKPICIYKAPCTQRKPVFHIARTHIGS